MARNRYASMHNAHENERRRRREEKAAKKEARRQERMSDQGNPFGSSDSWAPDPLAG